MVETHPFHPRIELTEYWPANHQIDNSDIHDEGAWLVAMDKGGAMSLWGPQDEMVEGSLPVYRSDDEKMLRGALVMFCRRGYETDERFVNQDGTVFLFNWRSFTLWQLGVAKRVLHLYAQGKVDEAWVFGRSCQDQIDAAVNSAYPVS